MMGDKVKRQIKTIEKLSIECSKCKSELIFDIKTHNEYNSLYNCPLCGSTYGFDPEDNVIERAKQLVTKAKQVKGAEIRFICEEDEDKKDEH
jgi:transposase-like protein